MSYIARDVTWSFRVAEGEHELPRSSVSVSRSKVEELLLSRNDSVLLRSTQLRPELYAVLNYNVDSMRTLLIFLQQLYSEDKY